jgi:hypothetical protein
MMLRNPAYPEKLPAWFPRLTRRLAIIFVGKAIPPAATFAAATAIATAVSSTATAAPRSTASTAAWTSKAAASRTRAARRTAFALRPRFIHFQIAAAGFFPVQARNRLRRFRIIWHFHESEPASPARFTIHGHVHPRDLPERLKQRTEIGLRRLKIHVPNKKTFHVASPGVFAAPLAREQTALPL